MKNIVFAFLAVSIVVFFLGCTQSQPQSPAGNQAPAPVLEAPSQGESSDISADLNDLNDLQNALDDTSIGDSGIDENSFS